MSNTSSRSRRFFRVWYQPESSMTREEWIYISCMLIVTVWAFALGMAMGFIIWTWFL